MYLAVLFYSKFFTFASDIRSSGVHLKGFRLKVLDCLKLLDFKLNYYERTNDDFVFIGCIVVLVKSKIDSSSTYDISICGKEISFSVIMSLLGFS